jgi:hypothetical protein
VFSWLIGLTVQTDAKRAAFKVRVKSTLAGLLSALLLLAAMVGASSSLHRLLHSDAAHHLCAACQFADGQVEVAAGADCLPTVCLCAAQFTPATFITVFSQFDYRLSFSRGPPRLSLRS